MMTLRIFAIGLLIGSSLWAAEGDWAEGVGEQDGATRDYSNRAAQLKWRNFLGDWVDADGKAQGEKAFASLEVSESDNNRPVRFDVSGLVRAWHKNKLPNTGFFFRVMGDKDGGGPALFVSREHEILAPRLEVKVGDTVTSLKPVADTFLEASTYRSIGGKVQLLRVGKSQNMLMRFDLSALDKDAEIELAILKVTVDRIYGGPRTVGVFLCGNGVGEPVDEARTDGIASRYAGDEGIAENDDVLFACDFEGDDWKGEWTHVGAGGNAFGGPTRRRGWGLNLC